MATHPQTLLTAEQFYQLPEQEGHEFELLDGEVIEMPSATPRHNFIVSKLIELLGPALRGRGKSLPDTDFSDGRKSTLRPDLAILLGEKPSLVDPDKLPVTVAPDIAVEVISYSESFFRVQRRIGFYLNFGVQEVWIIDPEEPEIQIHTEGGIKRLSSADALSSPLLPEWSAPVDAIFAP